MKYIQLTISSFLYVNVTNIKINYYYFFQAANPLTLELKKKLNPKSDITTAAVCVYPSRVQDACNVFKNLNLATDIKVAAGENVKSIILNCYFIFKEHLY